MLRTGKRKGEGQAACLWSKPREARPRLGNLLTGRAGCPRSKMPKFLESRSSFWPFAKVVASPKAGHRLADKTVTRNTARSKHPLAKAADERRTFVSGLELCGATFRCFKSVAVTVPPIRRSRAHCAPACLTHCRTETPHPWSGRVGPR